MIKRVLFLLNNAYQLDEEALSKAVSLAEKNEAALTVLCVLKEPDFAMHQHSFDLNKTEINEKIRHAARQSVAGMVEHVCTNLNPNIEVVFGSLYLQAIRYAIHHKFDMVVKSAQDPSWIDSIFDSDDMHLLRKCPVPIWLVNEGKHQIANKVVVALDFRDHQESTTLSEFNRQLLDIAIKLSENAGGELTLVHACSDALAGFASMWADNPEALEQQLAQDEKNIKRAAITVAKRYLESCLDSASENVPAIKTRLIDGQANETVAAFVKANETAILVMGTVGRTGVKGLFMGNTAESILQQVHCSVIAAKPKGFTSPVI